MTKIMKLTAEQEAELPAFRQKYLDIACTGGRANREKLQAAINEAYAVIGKPAPMLLIMPSPASSMLALSALKHLTGERGQLWGQLRDQLRGQLWDQLWGQLRDQLWGQLGDQLWDQLRGQLRGQLWDQLGDQLWGQLRGQLRGQLWDQLRDQLGDQLWGQLWGQLRGQLGDQLRGQLGDQLWGQLWGQLRGQLRDQLWGQLRGQKISNQPAWDPNFLWGAQDLYWIAWARFAQKIGVELRPETDRRLGIMERIAFQCEWWWPYDGLCVVSERPLFVKWDNERRLHCETGAAVEYADGYSLYAWRGIRIPSEWIEKGPPEAEKIMRIENVEQRRIAAEMRGWDKVIPVLPNAKLIDRHPNPQIGELWQADLPDHGTERFLQVRCGTGRTFGIPVGMTFNTALEANAGTYGISPQFLENAQFRT